MYLVVYLCFQTPNTKTFVLEHQHDRNAQKVIAKFIKFMKDSPRTSMEITRLTKYISTIRLDGTWRGTSETFLLHYKEQLRLLDELVPPAERMCERLRRLFLEQAVQDVPFLRNITNTDEYQRVLTNKTSVNYEQYFNLLLVASQRYDYQSVSYQKRRSVHNHHQDYSYPEEHLYDTSDTNEYPYQEPEEVEENDDTYEDEAYECYQASRPPPYRGPSTNPLPMRRPPRGPPHRGSPTKGPPHGRTPSQGPTPNCPTFTNANGPVFLPKDLWNTLSDDVKQQFFKYNQNFPKPGIPPPSPRQVHIQDVIPDNTPSDHPHESLANDHQEPEVENPFLDMIHDQSQLTPDDVRHLLSVNKGKRSDKVVHPVSRTTNNLITYTFSKSNTSAFAHLVDRGANGGLAGADMKILQKSGRKVNISGIDNHEITGLDVVTCASMFDTNQGRIIAIFHEYAYHGKGRSIHSPAQMEWFKAHKDDKSKAVGGLQRLLTLEGYIIPFEVHAGLVYMTPVGIPTDQDMDTYPHVILTSPHEWDPSIIDFTYASPAEWTHLGHPEGHEYLDTRFDEYGESTQRVIANLTFLLDLLPPATDASLGLDPGECTTLTISQHKTEPKEPDWEKLRPFFGYQPIESIKATWKVTTRHGGEGVNTYMRKHFKTRNPALNVLRRCEPVATDFIFGPAPSIEGMYYCLSICW